MTQSENKICQNCKQNFVIEAEDFRLYEHFEVPPATFCPDCRMIRRLAFRNERNLYKRPCDLCKEEKIMMYPKDASFPVYCFPCWWSDNWDAAQYARDYDFSKPFFEQYKELLFSVPRSGIIKQGKSVGSEYTNRVTDQRRCYLVFGSINNEDCRYSSWINDSKQLHDCYNVLKSERCYDCVDCQQSSNIAFSQESRECLNSWFLFNCRNCSDCFGCVNLRNKNYCIFNEQCSKEEYDQKIAELKFDTPEGFVAAKEKFENLKKIQIVPWAYIYQANDSTGNWVYNSKNVKSAFNCNNVEDARYIYGISNGKDFMDFWQWSAGSEKIYEAINAGIQCANLKFVNECWNQLLDSEYCMNCHSSQDLFGCSGIKKGQYYIFNKQYSESEYHDLKSKIIAQMKEVPYVDKGGRTYRYGEYFPIEISPFAYNETFAQEFFPITKEEAKKNGYPWRDEEKRNYSITLKSKDVPFSARMVSDEISKEVIACEHEGKCNHVCATAFRILKEDLEMHKLSKAPLPKLCPNCRHFDRLSRRNLPKLWSRKCACDYKVYPNSAKHLHHPEGSCLNEFETSYSPEDKAIVYCEPCYQQEVV
ncbi:MAG: hypothetical protein AAB787_02380 [Patescibacteria group bacterium]